ncbi:MULTISPECIES: phosphopantetheine-binding protein [Bacillati]|uniref:phosphopantetheine-binding protein n=1 Tax=Bacillati TaxID=1783272 RepID=UPI00366CA8D3
MSAPAAVHAYERLLVGLARAAGRQEEDRVLIETPLRDLGFESVSLVALYGAVERALEMEWSETVPQEALRSIAAMAVYLAETEGMPS